MTDQPQDPATQPADPASAAPATPPPPPPGPPPATTAAAPAAYGYQPQWGPPGRPRGIGFAILIEIVTLGIYGYYWVWVTQDEVKKHCGQGVGGPVGFIIYFVFSPVTFFLVPSEINKMLTMSGRPSPVTWKLGFWLFLPIIGWIIWFVKVQETLSNYWRELGVQG
jgi:hypothetical protein